MKIDILVRKECFETIQIEDSIMRVMTKMQIEVLTMTIGEYID